ncbi:MAG: hypothetical protein ABSE64_03985 [Vulcanimicrobiaceae bacterium]
MKNFAIAAFLVAVFATAGQSAFAQNGDSMATAKCKTGDPVVGVNVASKTYMTKSQMHAKMANMSASQQQQAEMQTKMMCKSEANAMGATMVGSPRNPASNAGH